MNTPRFHDCLRSLGECLNEAELAAAIFPAHMRDRIRRRLYRARRELDAVSKDVISYYDSINCPADLFDKDAGK